MSPSIAAMGRDIISSTQPTLMPKASDNFCKTVIMIVVVIVVTYITQGAATQLATPRQHKRPLWVRWLMWERWQEALQDLERSEARRWE